VGATGVTEGFRSSRGGLSADRGGRGGYVDRGGRGSRGTGRGYVPRDQNAAASPGPPSEFAYRPRAEVSIDGFGGAEEFSSAHLGGSQENIDDEEFAGPRRTKDFDIEGFLDQEPCYDRTDLTNKVRIIYFGDTARELEVQEERALVHKHKDPGWLLTKHEKLLERVRQRGELDQLAEELVFDDWAFVEDVDIIGSDTQVPSAPVIRTVEGDILPPQSVNDVETRYLAGYEAFQQQRPARSSKAIEDILRMPGLALQRTPTPKTGMDDILSAYVRRKEREHADADDAKVDELSLAEGMISEENIRKIMPTASSQGITEESVRIFASTLSRNRHLSLSEKLVRFRMLCGWNAEDRAVWEAKITAVFS